MISGLSARSGSLGGLGPVKGAIGTCGDVTIETPVIQP